MTVDVPSPDSERANTPEPPLKTGSSPDTQELVDVIRKVVAHKLGQQEAHGFDLQNYEILEKATYRELTPEDLPLVGSLYRALEMDSDIFYAMSQGDFETAEELASKGGMIHPWKPNDEERAIMEKPEFKRMCPSYMSCEDEFRTFLDGTHRRAADFRAFGMFSTGGELIGLACCFVPPKGTEQRRRHARQVYRFLQPTASWKRNFAPTFHSTKTLQELARHRAKTTAEFYLIAGRRRRAATFVMEHMIQQLVKEKIPITDMYLLRYGTMAMVYPHPDPRVGHGEENKPSGAFFKKRGFNNCAELTNRQEVALRKTRLRVFVGVQPTWMVMHAPFQAVIDGSRSEFIHLKNEALDARESERLKRIGSAEKREGL